MWGPGLNILNIHATLKRVLLTTIGCFIPCTYIPTTSRLDAPLAGTMIPNATSRHHAPLTNPVQDAPCAHHRCRIDIDTQGTRSMSNAAYSGIRVAHVLANSQVHARPCSRKLAVYLLGHDHVPCGLQRHSQVGPRNLLENCERHPRYVIPTNSEHE